MRKYINKKECRKFAFPNLHFEENSGIIHCDKVKYIVRCSLKNINHSRTLVIYIYIRKNLLENDYVPTYVVFQTKEDYITLKNVNGTTNWLKSKLDNLERIYNFTNKCAFYSLDDENLIVKFCNRNPQP